MEGKKFDNGKPPVGLIPREAIEAEAAVLEHGAAKYDRHNWRKGMQWSRLADASMRHILAWLDGEDFDPESGINHLAHARCSLGFLLTYQAQGLGADDRHGVDQVAPAEEARSVTVGTTVGRDNSQGFYTVPFKFSLSQERRTKDND